MEDTIPIRELVLYKHGVAYVQRSGRVSGTTVTLPLRDDEVDDVLKSLVVFTLDGGQVIGAHHRTRRERGERLSEVPLAIDARHSLFDLLREARGARVGLRLEGGGELRGRVLGVEEHPQGREEGATLVLLSGDTVVEQVETERVRGVELLDERLAADLDRFLEASRDEERDRTVTVLLSEPGKEVQASYTIPSPVWRVSYRVVGQEGQALLQGWAMFDNRLQDDLEDVEVTLIAGQPVSFRYDLTTSVVPARRLVQDEARAAAGPVEFGPVVAAAMSAPVPPMAAEVAGPAARYSLARMQRTAPEPDELAQATAEVAEGRELDELFEYRVSGVSLRRGESAMVPVVQHRGEYRRELLFDAAKLPRHPVVVLRLRNASGLTLERGPVTIVEDGQYRGEAIVPFTRAEGEIVLGYAVELGITVRVEAQEQTVMAGLELRDAYLHVQEYRIRRSAYALINRTREMQTVMVEQARWAGAELTETRPPDEETETARRWRVPCPPSGPTSFVVTERFMLWRHEALLDQQLASLAMYLEERFLDDETRRALEGILRLRQALADVERRMDEQRTERDELAARQERLRRNLSIQAASEQEREIRRRSAEDLQRAQEREAAVEETIERLKRERAELEAALARALRSEPA